MKRVNVAAALMGVDVPDDVEPSEVDRIVEEDQKLRERRAKLRAMKPWQRRKYQRDMKRVRWHLRLPKPVVKAVLEVAGEYKAPPASALSWLVSIALRETIAQGKTPPLEPSRDLRNETRVALPPEWMGERVRVMYDVDEDLRKQVDVLRSVHGCSLWSMVAWLVTVGMALYHAGVEPVMEPSTNLRYGFVLHPARVRGNAAENDVVGRLRRVLGDEA